MQKSINLFGVKTNNLKNITCRIPMRELTVLTGVSGSGKSSLAFDTLYAEGQRRFLESMSTYVRMFLDEMPKPPIERIENCLPAIALRQQSSFDHPRSTIATVTELLVHIAQLFANAASLHCVHCGGEVGRDTDTEIDRRLAEFGRKLKIVVYAEVRLSEGESAAQRLSALAAGGYHRLWNDHKIIELQEGDIEQLLDARQFSVLIDRVVYHPEKGLDGRMAEALEEGFQLGESRLKVDILDPDDVITITFDRRYTCRQCGEIYPPLRPENFDPNSTLGACPVCTGFGSVSGIDWNRVINPNLSIQNDAVIPLRTPSTHSRKTQLLGFCKRMSIPTDVPFLNLTREQQELVMFGKPPYKGVMGYFEMLMSKNQKFTARIQLARFRGYTPCEACDGSGMSSIARNIDLCGKSFVDVMRMTVSEALDFFSSIPQELLKNTGSLTPWEDILLRLKTLNGVGLGYLTLNRKSKTLSGGECQRLHLSCGLGRGLTDTLYVLDEPTAGLHPIDSMRLIRVMKSLQELGNTLVVVEHDTDVIEQADHIIELGPAGGEGGGKIIFEGDVPGLHQSDTPTGHMLRTESRTKLNTSALPTHRKIRIENASIHNLKNISVDIPLGQIVTVVGVSGSGKSTLIHDVLYQTWLMRDPEHANAPSDDSEDDKITVEFDSTARILGLEQFDDIIMMGQGALGRSLRACVATMTKAFSDIRMLFARQPDAVENQINASCFSFNTGWGRCQACEGLGVKTIEMMFMNDLTVPCPACGGKRFIPDVLAIRYRGKNISDVLEMTVSEARAFFAEYRAIAGPLATLCDVGLGYIRLGQSTSTLSGGEFQRLRLASYLERATEDNARTLFIFDEPTVGLHMQDVACLMTALQRLVAHRASIIVIEHNLDLIAQSHHIIELGPEGGPNGGRILFEGTPAQLAKANTPTGKAISHTLF
ncbi:MAG: excinuclease ABC subunit UvrA [Proteobacteria bacterium]|nr:excinuclease ABC subunit UvrA [Pseudomonadota bacterium]